MLFLVFAMLVPPLRLVPLVLQTPAKHKWSEPKCNQVEQSEPKPKQVKQGDINRIQMEPSETSEAKWTQVEPIKINKKQMNTGGSNRNQVALSEIKRTQL